MRGEANGGEEDQRRPRGEEHQDEEEEEEHPRPAEGAAQQRQHSQGQRTARPSSGPQQPTPPAMRNVGYVGKHRLSAAIARLDQELQSLQEQ